MTTSRMGRESMGFMLTSQVGKRPEKPDFQVFVENFREAAAGMAQSVAPPEHISVVLKDGDQEVLRQLRDLLTDLLPMISDKLMDRDFETYVRLVDTLVDRTPAPPAVLVQSQMQARAMNRILESGDWLTAAQVAELGQRSGSNPSAHTSKWKKQGQIFSIEFKSREYYPSYALDPEDLYRPRPGLKRVLEVFGKAAKGWRLAFWFDSPNSWLDGKRPKECLAEDVEPVVFAAEKEAEGVQHG